MNPLKAEKLLADLRNILLLGRPFTGKTTMAATSARPILVFAGDASVDKRLAGQKDIDIIHCFDCDCSHCVPDPKKPAQDGDGLKRFDLAFKELLGMNPLPYKTVAIDPINFIFDRKLNREMDINSTNVQGAFGSLLKYGRWVTDMAMRLPCYTIVTCHIKYGVLDMAKETITKNGKKIVEAKPVGDASYLPALQGSIKDVFSGVFDAVFYTEVIEGQFNAPPKYVLKYVPNSEYQCGVKVPIGKEHLLKGNLEPNLQKLIARLREATR